MGSTLYTPTEAAEILRVSAQTVTRYARTGRLSGSKPGGKLWRFSQKNLDDFFANGDVASQPQRKPDRRPGAR
jgi:excisionase family DNA binding protein